MTRRNEDEPRPRHGTALCLLTYRKLAWALALLLTAFALVAGSACSAPPAAPSTQIPHERITSYALPTRIIVDIDGVLLEEAPDALPKHYTVCTLLVTATTPPGWKLLTTALAPSQTAWDVSFRDERAVIHAQIDAWAALKQEGIAVSVRNDCFAPPTLVVDCPEGPADHRRRLAKRIGLVLTLLFTALYIFAFTRW